MLNLGCVLYATKYSIFPPWSYIIPIFLRYYFSMPWWEMTSHFKSYFFSELEVILSWYFLTILDMNISYQLISFGDIIHVKH